MDSICSRNEEFKKSDFSAHFRVNGGQWLDRAHVTINKSRLCDELENILWLLVGRFFALDAVVTLVPRLFVIELMVRLRSEFVGVLDKLLPISYVSECGEVQKRWCLESRHCSEIVWTCEAVCHVYWSHCCYTYWKSCSRCLVLDESRCKHNVS